MDPSIRRIPTTTQIRGRELQGFLYERSFDQRYTNHLLEMLLSIVRFGGQGFAKTARTTVIKRSHHGGLIERVESGKLTPSSHASSCLMFHLVVSQLVIRNLTQAIWMFSWMFYSGLCISPSLNSSRSP